MTMYEAEGNTNNVILMAHRGLIVIRIFMADTTRIIVLGLNI